MGCGGVEGWRRRRRRRGVGWLVSCLGGGGVGGGVRTEVEGEGEGGGGRGRGRERGRVRGRERGREGGGGGGLAEEASQRKDERGNVFSGCVWCRVDSSTVRPGGEEEKAVA